MANVEIHTPTLTVTNPLLLWLFKHGMEDHGWGQSPVGQIAVASAIHELANQITDTQIRKQIQAGAAKSMANVADKMASDG